jgi:hypothetical protein
MNSILTILVGIEPGAHSCKIVRRSVMAAQLTLDQLVEIANPLACFGRTTIDHKFLTIAAVCIATKTR